MHHVLSGFKALMTDSMIANVETARRACGGAGYTSNSGFTELYQNVSPMPTYEGENTVMLLQAARYLIKLTKKVGKGEKLPFPFQYLNDIRETLSRKNRAHTIQDCLDLDILDLALQSQACNQINTTMTAYNASG